MGRKKLPLTTVDVKIISEVMAKVVGRNPLTPISYMTYFKRGWSEICTYLDMTIYTADRHLSILGVLKWDFDGKPFFSILEYYVRFMEMQMLSSERHQAGLRKPDVRYRDTCKRCRFRRRKNDGENKEEAVSTMRR